jgi:DNA-binding sugar fermentation-stimulating protein
MVSLEDVDMNKQNIWFWTTDQTQKNNSLFLINFAREKMILRK